MKHKRPPIPVIIILVLAVLVGGYFGIRALLNPASTALTASGTIEAVEVTISPEIGGKVAEVSVDEGAQVKAVMCFSAWMTPCCRRSGRLRRPP